MSFCEIYHTEYHNMKPSLGIVDPQVKGVIDCLPTHLPI